MFFLGILSILQALFLPGMLGLSFFPKIRNLLIRMPVMIALSLTINYTVCFFLAVIGLFQRWLILGLILLEIGFLVWKYWSTLKNTTIADVLVNAWNKIVETAQAFFPGIEPEDKNAFTSVLRILYTLLAITAAVIGIEWMTRALRYSLGTIFTQYDAIVNYHNWAMQWVQGRMPTFDDYPHLNSLNYAMMYQIIGTVDVQFFAKAITGVFSSMLLVLMFGLGVETKNNGFFLAVIMVRYMLKRFSNQYLASGYIDIPLSFMALSAISLLYLTIREPDEQRRWKLALLAMVAAAGTAITKQAGLYVLAWISFFLYFAIFKNLHPSTLKREWKRILILVLIPLIITIPWYGIVTGKTFTGGTGLHIGKALDHSTEVSGSTNIFLTMVSAVQSLGIYGSLVLLVLPAVFLMESFWRKITLSITIPYFILWAGFASYDTRNLTLTFPLITIAVGLGIHTTINWGLKLIQRWKLRTIPVWVIVLLLLLVPAALSLVWTSQEITEKQVALQKQILDAELNQAIYEILGNAEEDTVVLSRYPFEYLPDLELTKLTFMFRDTDEFLQILEENPQIDFILKPAITKPGIDEWVAEALQSGLLVESTAVDGVIPYQILQFQKE